MGTEYKDNNPVISEIWERVHHNPESFSQGDLGTMESIIKNNLKMILFRTGQGLEKFDYESLVVNIGVAIYSGMKASPLPDNPAGYIYTVCRNEFSKILQRPENTPITKFIEFYKKTLKELENSGELYSHSGRVSRTNEGVKSGEFVPVDTIRERLKGFILIEYSESEIWTPAKKKEFVEMIFTVLKEPAEFTDSRELRMELQLKLNITDLKYTFVKPSPDNEEDGETKDNKKYIESYAAEAEPEPFADEEYDALEERWKTETTIFSQNPKNIDALISGYEKFVKQRTLKEIAEMYHYRGTSNVDSYINKFKEHLLQPYKQKFVQISGGEEKVLLSMMDKFRKTMETFIPTLIEVKNEE